MRDFSDLDREAMPVTRASEIADYLLSTGIGDTEAAWKAEVVETIVARCPDVTREDLTVAFQIALAETAAAWAGALAAQVEAGTMSRHGRPTDGR